MQDRTEDKNYRINPYDEVGFLLRKARRDGELSQVTLAERAYNELRPDVLIGGLLQEERVRKNWDTDKLFEAVDALNELLGPEQFCGNNTIRKIEQGQRRLSFVEAAALSIALNRDIRRLLPKVLSSKMRVELIDYGTRKPQNAFTETVNQVRKGAISMLRYELGSQYDEYDLLAAIHALKAVIHDLERMVQGEDREDSCPI